MASATDIATHISQCSDDILVLIRGGGDATDFGVFETPVVLEALGSSRSFRLLGLGHSQHRTLADCVADHAAAVPAEAGRFLVERLAAVRQQLVDKREIADLRSLSRNQWSVTATFIVLVLIFLAGIVTALLLVRWTGW